MFHSMKVCATLEPSCDHIQSNECSQTFPSKESLAEHKKVIISTKEKPYKCLECEKSFALKSNLKTHQRIHTGEKPYKCLECEKSFAEKSNLKKHQRIHTGEKPFKCNICEKSFALNRNLKTHQCIHTEEKPFKCNICKKSFSYMGNLKTHEHLHTGKNRFQCYICGKTFSQKGNLKSHELIHAEKNPSQCKICGKYFTQKRNLKSHKRIHAKDNASKCDQGSKAFTEQKEHPLNKNEMLEVIIQTYDQIFVDLNLDANIKDIIEISVRILEAAKNLDLIITSGQNLNIIKENLMLLRTRTPREINIAIVSIDELLNIWEEKPKSNKCVELLEKIRLNHSLLLLLNSY